MYEWNNIILFLFQLYKQWTSNSNDTEEDAMKEKARQGFNHQAEDSEWVRF